MDFFFKPKSVAVIGASRKPGKIGYAVFRNFYENYKGRLYPVNVNAEKVQGVPAFKSILDVPGSIDLAVIVTPAETVPRILIECGEKKVKGVVIISSGFSEVGNKALEERIRDIIDHYGMRVIGPNCLGVFDAYSNADTLFLPSEKLGRPRKGSISFISQSGAVGSIVLDWMSGKGYGVSKFVSYGNAVDVNETDLINYLAQDKTTKVICAYLEGVKNGKKFMNAVRRAVKKKPVIVLKGGRTEAGSKAVASHTGSMAGSDRVYDAAFKQSGAIRAGSMVEMFDYARAMMQPLPKGNKVQVITNGGGFGVLAADQVVLKGLKLAELSKKSREQVKAILPKYAGVHNPLDLVGDADDERFKNALKIVGKDKNVDMILLILLYQTAPLTPCVTDHVINFAKKSKKPLVVCSPGGPYTQLQAKKLEENDIPVFDTPATAVNALAALHSYAEALKE